LEKGGIAEGIFKGVGRLHRHVKLEGKKSSRLRGILKEKFNKSLCIEKITDQLLQKESVYQRNWSL
jgi:hypothetical protein